MINGDDFKHPSANWTVEVIGDRIALRADSGKYLAKCDIEAFADIAFVYAKSPKTNPWALWTPVNIERGRWALRSSNGKLLSRCSINSDGSTNYPDFACLRDTESVEFSDIWFVPSEF